jgi:phage protein U
MRNYMARLGGFSFGIDTAAFQELQRASSYRWEAKNRIGRRPAQQNLGEGVDTISLSGVIHPHYRGGLGQMGALRALAAAGNPLPLVYAFESAGLDCGQWCIAAIDETRTVFFDNGAPRRIEFRLSLVQYGEDSDASPLVQLAKIAGAPVVSTVDAVGAASEAATVASQAGTVTSAAGALGMISQAASVARDVTGTISTAVSSVLNSDAVRLARTAVTEVNKLRSAARAMSSAVDSVSRIADNPSTALGALGNLVASAGAMSDVLGSSAEKLGLRAADYNGPSAASLHLQQIASATSTLSTLASAADSIKSTANTLRGFL